MEINEFADLLKKVAENSLENPPVVPPDPPVVDIDDTAIKSAIKAVSLDGVPFLQRALMVNDDGIIGPITTKALKEIDIHVLISRLNQSTPSNDLSFEALAPEYISLYMSSIILPKHKAEVDGIATKIMQNGERYAQVTSITNVPWHVIGIIHSLECNLSFSRHLHNGDLLSFRTVNVPEGRPVTGDPPFKWNVSAVDSLQYSGLDKWTDWSPEGVAYALEGKVNGFGYRKYTHIKSPYLWSFTNVYTKGKYDVDGHFDPNLVSEQAGGMAILKELIQWI